MVSVENVESWFRFQQVVYLATSEGDQPRVRPVSLINFKRRFYVITGARGGVNAEKLLPASSEERLQWVHQGRGHRHRHRGPGDPGAAAPGGGVG